MSNYSNKKWWCVICRGVVLYQNLYTLPLKAIGLILSVNPFFCYTFRWNGVISMKTNKIHLEKISWDNYEKVLKLRVNKEQESYVASNKASLIHAFIETSMGTPVYAFAIMNGKVVVGFMQLVYGKDWTGYDREDWLTSETFKQYEDKPYYYIWRFMIDKKYQKRGYGREAFKQTLDFIKTFPNGKVDYVLLSYEQSNEVGRQLYASFGFEEVFKEYLHDDDEVTAMLKL